MSDGDPFAGRPVDRSLLALSRAQQFVLVGSLCLVGAWVVVTPRWPGTVFLAALLFSAGCGPDGRSGVDRAIRVVSYASRSRWTYVTVSDAGARLALSARGTSECVLGQLSHRGRLDLNGTDQEIVADGSALMDRLAASSGDRRLSWRLSDEPHGATTTLAVPVATPLPRSWTAVDPDDVVRTCGLARGRRQGWLLERWGYLRTSDAVVAVFALRATTGGTHGALRGLVPYGSGRELVVHVVVSSTRAARRAVERQSHRWRANLALASLAGFRSRASSTTTSAALDHRELEIASGRALGQVAVFVVVRAATRIELERRAAALCHDAGSVGASLERGNGRHAAWFCAQLPGSPAWRAS